VGRVVIEGPDALVAPNAFTTLALVIHELTTNSCKYGALSDTSGTIQITLSRGDDGSLELDWREEGGPPVKAPTRRGFGSTIIERTIPHELGGSASVVYPAEGLHALFLVPVDHVSGFETPGAHIREVVAEPPQAAEFTERLASGTALIVEDNVIIAMEAEDLLRGFGFTDCRIAGSVETAMDLLENAEVSFAMLDVNLGKDTSAPVATALNERGIPFIFASGYGERSLQTGAFKGVPVVTKPYGERDVRAAIGRVLKGR
jgi:CheY-like chemotaxis protein